MVVFYLCAFSNSLVFPDAELMCQRMLKHFIRLFLFLLLKFSCSMSCTVMIYTPEGFLLAYFVAKGGNGISLYLYACYVCAILHLFFIYAYLYVVVFILQLFQVMCRCWHSCCNILMFLTMI